MFRSRLLILAFLIIIPSLSEASRVVLLVGSYRYHSLNRALKELKVGGVEIFNETSPENKIANSLKDAKMVVVDIMMPTLRKIALKYAAKAKLYAVNSSENDQKLKDKGFIFLKKLSDYYANPLMENYKNLILYSLYLSGSKVSFKEPIVLPRSGIYHPSAPGIFKNPVEYLRWYKTQKGYWVWIIFYQAYLDPTHRGFLDYLIKKVEQKGLRVIAAYGYPATEALKLLIKGPKPEVILSFAFKMSHSRSERNLKILKELNVPVINLINLFSEDVERWKSSKTGLSTFEVSWQMGMPELSGLIEPIVAAGPTKDKRTYIPAKKEIDFLIDRIQGWIRLRHKPNSSKRIAIVYYNHAPGKQNIGASYLNTFRSIVNILKALKKEGYKVGNIPGEDVLRRLLLTYGRNIGSWAPGELERLISRGQIIKIPIDRYLKWYRKLPKAFRRRVEEQWGPPKTCSIMCTKGYIIIPGMIIGNIFIGPQPARGVAGDAWKMYHDTKVYPHHQYIAFYLWLKHGFKADAIIHLGTHGTLEWLPGKQAGLPHTDPPYLLHQDIMDIYPYVVDDVGEGIQAKRRGLAVIIDHLTPPVVKAELYGEYAKLYELINRLETSNSPKIEKERISRIKRLAERMGLTEELKIRDWNNKAIQKLEHKLIQLKEDLTPYGLHTFGVSPSGKILNAFARAIGTKEAYSRLKASGPRELSSLIKALSGGYIEPGTGNDPVRNPDSIPTGKNFYAFDPHKIPSPEAWRAAVKLTDEMLKDYLKKHKRYPRKVSIVLWATETIRNEGINEAEALYLMGIKPVWDKNGKIKGVIPIPGRLLKRPRIDVLIHASGLYRDMFPNMLKMLDRAVRLAATLKDTENFLAENSGEIEKELVAKGMSRNEAKELSLSRVFSEEPGSYGTGVALLTANTGFWDKPEQIASVFLNRTGFVFGQKRWGEKHRFLYELNLYRVDVAIHSISSNLYRALDNDDVFQYLGGVTLTVKALTGRFPEAIINRDTGKNNWTEDLKTTLRDEARTRYFNPRWIRGMMKEGYSGAREMDKFVEYLWGWQVTAPFAVDQRMWEQVFEIYVKDRYRLHLKKFFDRYNPWAFQSILAWELEAIRKGYWKASEKIKIELARRYALEVIEKGVACCEHTCNNPFLNTMVINILSSPEINQYKLALSFRKTIEKATGEDVIQASHNRLSKIKKIATEVKRMVKGVELKEKSRKEENTSASGIQKVLMLIALLFTLTFLYGFKKESQ